MKKIFTSFVIMFAVCLYAAAQTIPNKFNYQGVCDQKSAEITVEFSLLDKEDQAIYTETHTVTTNANGMFSAKIGDGTATTGEWSEIDWATDTLSLKTSVNGALVSKCYLAAVPYAQVAASYVGQKYVEDDIQALTEASRNWAAISTVTQLGEDLTTTQGDVMSLTKGNRENRVAVNDIITTLNKLKDLLKTLHSGSGTEIDAIEIPEIISVEGLDDSDPDNPDTNPGGTAPTIPDTGTDDPEEEPAE